MSGHRVRVTLSTDDVSFRFECCDPDTCDVRVDEGQCWPTNYAGDSGRLEEFYDGDAPAVPLHDGAQVEFLGGYDPDEWTWRIVDPTPRATDAELIERRETTADQLAPASRADGGTT